MSKVLTVLKILTGAILKPLSYLLNQDKDLWVIGSGKGFLFSDNSKFFFQYVHNYEQQVRIFWISQNKELVKELRSKGYRAEYNFSFRGLITVLKARVYIFSTLRSDILFYFPVKHKIIVNLFHAMPIKKIIYDYDGLDLPKTPVVSSLWNKLVVGFIWENIQINIATSKFFEEILKGAYRNENVISTGMPRCDIFFEKKDPEIIKVINPDNKFIITYLPTHRRFGKGNPNPVPFIENQMANRYFRNNNIQIVFKMHYNMASDNEMHLNENLIDVTNENVDTQELMKISDILISDYSSVIIDYLLLDRPQILYFYDDYKNKDTGLYIDVEKQENAPGKIAFNEDELFAEIKELFEGRDKFQKIRKDFKDKYFTYKDGNSSKRIVAEINDKINY
jgi:CDP-glycerol glycerophosphotransferase